jgi:hypothetical protein
VLGAGVGVTGRRQLVVKVHLLKDTIKMHLPSPISFNVFLSTVLNELVGNEVFTCH